MARIPNYTAFAMVYDETMHEVPFDRWSYFISNQLEDLGVRTGGTILDIGAGTGVVAGKLSGLYNLIAIDLSREMLEIAVGRKSFHCLQANMVALPLAEKKIDGAFSTHDCVNYLENIDDVSTHLAEVHRVLKKKGIYIIDFSTEYNVLKNFHHRTFEERHGNLKMKWTNVYDPVEKIITSTIDITIFSHSLPILASLLPKTRFREVHRQRIYSEKQMEDLALNNGFRIVGKYYDYKPISSGNKAHLVVLVLQKK